MIKLTNFTKSSYLQKDQKKSDKATCFIGFGTPNSSTARYSACWGKEANKGEYCREDRVFVSINGGMRFSKENWERTKAELLKAMEVPVAHIITDNAIDRLREYNRGERYVAAFLAASGWVQTQEGNGEWVRNGT